jgi:hypothetical protein
MGSSAGTHWNESNRENLKLEKVSYGNDANNSNTGKSG